MLGWSSSENGWSPKELHTCDFRYEKYIIRRPITAADSGQTARVSPRPRNAATGHYKDSMSSTAEFIIHIGLTIMFSGGSTPSQSAQNLNTLQMTKNLSHMMSKIVYTNSARIPGLKLPALACESRSTQRGGKKKKGHERGAEEQTYCSLQLSFEARKAALEYIHTYAKKTRLPAPLRGTTTRLRCVLARVAWGATWWRCLLRAQQTLKP